MTRPTWLCLALLVACSGAAPAVLQDPVACAPSPEADAGTDAGLVADAAAPDAAAEDAAEASADTGADDGPYTALIACLQSDCAGCCSYGGCRIDGLTNPTSCGRLGGVCVFCPIGQTCSNGACGN